MKRNLYFLLLFFLFFSCRTELFNKNEELTIELPSWPEALPKLEFYLIKINSSQSLQEEVFLLKDKSFCLDMKKNQPLSLQAFPVTRLPQEDSQQAILPDSQLIQFFKPAGAIYPYDYDYQSKKMTLYWEGGYSASLINQLFEQRKLSDLSPQEINEFIKSFNWKKLNSLLCKKSQEAFYNPWHINTENLLTNLSQNNFSQSLADPVYVYPVKTADLSLSRPSSFYSSYVPENQLIKEEETFYIKKDLPQLFLYQNLGAYISFKSAKNISLEWIYMPIFKEDL